MGCCEKLKYERLKELSHASILTSQIAHILKKKMAVVMLTHQDYGNYYDGMDYKEAFSKGYRKGSKDPKTKIFETFEPS